MNQHRSEQEWAKVAREFGHDSMRELLYKYYVDKGMTAKQIGVEVLDVSRDRVLQLLKLAGIPARRRGGIHG